MFSLTMVNFYLCILVSPLIGGFLILFLHDPRIIKIISITVSFLIFSCLSLVWSSFDQQAAGFQLLTTIDWIKFYNINLVIGVDGVSMLFIMLTSLLIPLCMVSSFYSVQKQVKLYFFLFLLLEFLLLLIFSTLDLFFFYIFFEGVLIPMYLIIGIWGSRERKIRASYMFFLYTLIGSVLMLLAILAIYHIYGTTDYLSLLTVDIDPFFQKICWLAFFASFAVKVPMFPFHIWLPEAHVEAPTAGSVILAGVLLKLGSYGLIRFSVPLFPVGTAFFGPFVNGLAILGVMYCSATAIRQTDIKRVIAYSSVAHMNIIILGLFSGTVEGIAGSILQMISHGLGSSGLFLCIGVLYDRYHSRLVSYYNGIVHYMPIFNCFLLMYFLSTISLPGTGGFPGELLIFTGLIYGNTVLAFLSASSMILGGIYSLWLFNRISFGNLQNNFLKVYHDLSFHEIIVHIPLIFCIFFMGIYPTFLLNFIHLNVNNIILIYDFISIA
jgi:NADH-quinone oxidoreductase subunit M